jgi:hypothetical protein
MTSSDFEASISEMHCEDLRMIKMSTRAWNSISPWYKHFA